MADNVNIFQNYMNEYLDGYNKGFNKALNKLSELYNTTDEKEKIDNIVEKQVENQDDDLQFTADEVIILEGKSHLWNVGDIVQLHSFGKKVDFRVVHKHYFTNGKVILMPTKIFCSVPFDAFGNSYPNSYIREFINRMIFRGFETEIQNAMTECDIKCWEVDKTININDKVFVPSIKELGLLDKYISFVPKEGTKFDYFNTDLNRKMELIYPCYYWTRTPCKDNSIRACVIDDGGSCSYQSTECLLGLVFAFEV